MMKIMSVNAGSSSLKFSLFEIETETLIASGYFEKVTIPGSFFNIKYNGEKIYEEIEMPNHTIAVEIMLDRLVSLGIVSSLDEISAVGHRVVHGGDKYDKSVLITDEVLKDIEELSSLAPLHNPANLLGIKAVQSALPNVPMVVVFDTAFHQTMEPTEYMYPVPYEWYTDYKVRKYGFHGTSHCYVSKQIPGLIGKDSYKAIICHLGSGGSLSAVCDGKCVDTTMGFTPLAGIMMGTRSGDIDPSIVSYMSEVTNKTAGEIVNDLNKKSGFIGLSGVSSDFRDVYKGVTEGNERCKLAFEKYAKTVVDYIASYYVTLGGADVICFTAGLGENALEMREKIMEKLGCLGVVLNKENNNTRGETIEISAPESKIRVFVVPTNEELMIAQDTYEIIK
ncbi:MAG: acetate kinase [Bacilli bacterium]|nr:acetate kinase [Bacilli bacterium]